MVYTDGRCAHVWGHIRSRHRIEVIVVSSMEELPVFAVPAGFRPPRWLGKGDRRHIPEPTWTLAKVRDLSEGKEGNAWYDPQLSIAEIERIEMDSVRETCEIEKKRKPHQRVYFRHLGRVIGVSKGKTTEYVYVFYNREGGVHGFPITLQELRNKGAPL